MNGDRMKKIIGLLVAGILGIAMVMASPATATNSKIQICHQDQSSKYELIEVSVNGLNGHGDHEGDIIPADENCLPQTPAATPTVTETVTATATATVTATATTTSYPKPSHDPCRDFVKNPACRPSPTVTVTETITNDQTIPIRMVETVTATATVTEDAAGNSVATSEPVDDQLASTGSPILIYLLLGLGLIGAGIMARRLTRVRTH
jgi:hypothetical protein